MFDSEKSMVYTALMGWAKYIETGDFSGMDKKTLLELARNDKDIQRVVQRLPVLTREQQEVVYKIEDLAVKILNGGQVDS
ncbi:hypothetical protein VPH184E373B_0222 [Vibrio phage 184E37-3b]|nr:hypothetical protein MYOV056v2_p0198 [Vibrio phage 184E37.3a]QZI90106.1 hypothetical protein MYOV057v1_p0191 [Vibrio phage 184E37.1]